MWVQPLFLGRNVYYEFGFSARLWLLREMILEDLSFTNHRLVVWHALFSPEEITLHYLSLVDLLAVHLALLSSMWKWSELSVAQLKVRSKMLWLLHCCMLRCLLFPMPWAWQYFLSLESKALVLESSEMEGRTYSCPHWTHSFLLLLFVCKSNWKRTTQTRIIL